ncbi:DNA-directed DNA polymerase II small subunit [Thermococcus sp. Bubb.Bath]|uniref:DNA-directed DNA polymerase II small subunit n=1 Tax=Thermococcus sp. Bubb.Bath TaxID=1638242 RepID=UPI00143C6438|nr:DNA-directed DNA polymerase II small subunit [Thermococcus sp. Bubb.Bath]NJF25059.1 DNA-directed DNA polymerase II small subunit [Thermococcus sp. Bubb.Bath]
MLVEDLLKNNYLITPPAYYLLEPHYGESFTLAELIKFVKSKGTFVVDASIVEEFLREKGLISTGTSSETKPSEPLELESGDTEIDSAKEQRPEVLTPDLEGNELESPPKQLPDEAGYISTGTPPETVEGSPGSSEIESSESHISDGGSFISTGDVFIENSSEMEVSEGSLASSEELPVETELPDEDISDTPDDVVETASAVPVDENGYNGYSEYENGNGDTRPLVYGDYGIPITYVEEEVPEENGKTYSVYDDITITPKEGFRYRAAEIPEEAEVVFDVKNVKFNPPKAKNAAGKEGEFLVSSYRSLFRSRLRKMRSILRENPEIGGIIDIGKLSYVRSEGDVTIVGMVNDKRETAKGYVLELEDTTGRVKVFINREREDSKLVMNLMHNAVIAVRGRYSGRGMVFADRIFIPDVPRFKRNKPPLKEKVYAILLSDIHVGSRKFCEEAFFKFLDWLNGEVENEAQAELVSRIKYIIFGGDVVDGVGIYPGQYDELAIPDIFDQYEAFANLLKNVPRHIHMFIGPGNHDAARTALPQPGFYEEYARPLYKLKNATVISNPAVIRLHGRDFLIAHGRGIEDVVNEIPNRSHHRPAEAMLELLKLRHLAPTFGGKVPIAPDPEDLLVIESVPDLFQMGHVHVMEYKMYNGVFLINSGTWQAQTEFQKMVNIVPTPARVPIIDVETARLRAVVSFDQFCEGV